MESKNHSTRPRVVLADDHPISRYGMRVALTSSQEAQVVGEVGSAHELFRILETIPCDAVLADYVMPDEKGGDGLSMVKKLVRDHPNLPVVIVTALRNHGLLEAALREGAKGWIEKSEDHAELVQAIREVINGRTYVGGATRALLQHPMGTARAGEQVSLTGAETRVLCLSVYEALTLGQIAERLGCSYKIVSRHKRAALVKLGLKNDQELYEYCRWVDLRI